MKVPPRIRLKANKLKIYALLEVGLSQSSIAKEFKVSLSSLRSFLEQNSIKEEEKQKIKQLSEGYIKSFTDEITSYNSNNSPTQKKSTSEIINQSKEKLKIKGSEK